VFADLKWPCGDLYLLATVSAFASAASPNTSTWAAAQLERKRRPSSLRQISQTVGASASANEKLSSLARAALLNNCPPHEKNPPAASLAVIGHVAAEFAMPAMDELTRASQRLATWWPNADPLRRSQDFSATAAAASTTCSRTSTIQRLLTRSHVHLAGTGSLPRYRHARGRSDRAGDRQEPK